MTAERPPAPHARDRFLGRPISPLTRRRLDNFRANRRGFWSLWIFLALFRRQPVRRVHRQRPAAARPFRRRLLFPGVRTIIPKPRSAAIFPTAADYRDPEVQKLIEAKGWMVWPPIPFSYNTINYDLPSPAPSPPSRGQLARHRRPGPRRAGAADLRLSHLGAVRPDPDRCSSSVIGVAAGAVQGYFGGLVDLGFQRFIEIWSGLPVLYLLIILASFVEPNFWWLLGPDAAVFVDGPGRCGARRVPARAQFRLCAGGPRARRARPAIILRHVLPNATVATITFLPFILNGSITTLTSLDFLGFGLPPGSASLGELLAQGKANLQAPWLGHHRVLRAGADAEPADLHRRGGARRVRPAQGDG